MISGYAYSTDAVQVHENSRDMSWDELEAVYGQPASAPDVDEALKIQKRRELEEQLSKQFASLSRGLSHLPEPPDVQGKEISFGKAAKKRR